MATKESAVVLNFKLKGQVEYAKTIKDINAVMNAAAKEYRASIRAMGDEASATDKLTVEKKKLEIQLNAAKERTEKLRNEFELMQGNTKATTAQLSNLYGKLKDSESAELFLEKALKKVNNGLSEQSEESRKNQKALDGLQSESKELELQSQKLTSEFKLQQSELGKNATEADKAALAHDHLGKQSEVVEKQISNLERQLKLVKSEFGENSDEAQKMEIELNEAKTAFNNLGHEMDGMTGSAAHATDGMDKLTNVLSSQVLMQVADKLSVISDKLFEIGQESIAAAATFRASEAQFEQIFGAMQGQAQQTVDDLGDKFGILPNRLKPAYAAITSQFMSLGISQKEAMAMAAEATTNAADSAAFYDLSLENAQERVQSFLKGNLSAAESIGIFASVASLDAYAIENLGVKYSEMDEKQKQSIRLEYITHLQEQAKVTGQAAREMDGYENVMGNAKSVQEEFNAALGDAALEMVIDSMSQLLPMIVDFTKWYKELNPVIKQGVIIFGAVLIVGGKLLPFFATLAAAAAVAGTTMSALFFGTILPAVGFVLAIVAGITALVLVIKNWGAISDWIKDKWDKSLKFISEKWSELKDSVKKTFDSIAASISSFFTNSINDISKFFSDIWTSITGFFDELITTALEKWSKFVTDTVKYWTELGEKIGGFFTNLKKTIDEKLSEIGEFFAKGWQAIVDAIEPIWDGFVRVIMVPISFIQTALEAFWLIVKAGFTIAWEAIKIATEYVWNLITSALETAWEFIVSKAEIIWSAVKDNIINPIIEAYDWLVQKFTDLGVWFGVQWESIKELAAQTWASIKDSIIQPIVETYNKLVQIVTDIFTALGTKFDEIKTNVLKKWSEIKTGIVDFFTQAYQSVTKIAGDIWTGVTEKFDNILSSTKRIFKNIGDAIVAPIIWAKDKIEEAINNIKDFFAGLKFPHFSLKTSSKTILGKEIEFPSGIDVKWNAKGGIFTQPTIFGASGTQLQGAGEAGPEAVIPLNDETLAGIGKGIAANMPGGVTQHITFGKVDANNPSELARVNRQMKQADDWSKLGVGGSLS